MKVRKRHKVADHSGSSFDSFLDEHGIREEVEAVAIKRVLAWQIGQAMRQQRITKAELARRMHTSRPSVDRLLDPDSASVTLETMNRAANAVGKRLRVFLEGEEAVA